MSANFVKVTTTPVEVAIKSSGQTVVVPSSKKVHVVTVGKVGPSGPVGPQGAAGSPRIEVPFSFGDATPLQLVEVAAGKLIERITLFVDIAFDGIGPSLTIGDNGDPDALMTSTENDPREEAAYQVTPNLRYETDTDILLFITPGLGASQGSGLVVIETQT